MRPTTPIPLTLEEHRELGNEMRRTRARIHELCGLVTQVYGPNNRAAFDFMKTAGEFDRLCAELQNQAEHDLPGYPVEGLYI
jgi:hypothetical protein